MSALVSARSISLASYSRGHSVAAGQSVDLLPVERTASIIYVHFSSPMSEGWAARAVRVLRADNDEPLEGVFLAMEPELFG